MRKGIRLVLVTLGARGVYYRYGYTEGVVEGFRVTVADTNGAGDTFLAQCWQSFPRGKEFCAA